MKKDKSEKIHNSSPLTFCARGFKLFLISSLLKRSVEGIISIYSRVDKILQRDRTWLYICLATLHQHSDSFIELHHTSARVNEWMQKSKKAKTIQKRNILPLGDIAAKRRFQNTKVWVGKINLVKPSINLRLKIIFLKKTIFSHPVAQNTWRQRVKSN